jgi:hypothetical protein
MHLHDVFNFFITYSTIDLTSTIRLSKSFCSLPHCHSVYCLDPPVTEYTFVASTRANLGLAWPSILGAQTLASAFCTHIGAIPDLTKTHAQLAIILHDRFSIFST